LINAAKNIISSDYIYSLIEPALWKKYLSL
jgi:hypothetical protein